MNKQQSPWKPIALSLGVVAAMAGGSLYRDRMEMGPASVEATVAASVKAPSEGSGLVASLEKAPNRTSDQMFYQIVQLLDDNYVDPIKDRDKLSSGAIRGMVNHLADPYAVFMDKGQFAAFNRGLAGQVEGIGAELRLVYDEGALAKFRKQRSEYVSARRQGKTLPELTIDSESLLPRIVVSAVFPGSGAAKAGLKPGDVIERVNDLWVWSGQSSKDLEKLRTEMQNPKITDKRIEEIRKEFQDRVDQSIMPGKAIEKLLTGTTGEVQLRWQAGTESKEAKVAKSPIKVPVLEKGPEGFRVALLDGIAEAVDAEIRKTGTIKLDLRNVPNGDMKHLQALLAKLLPAGDYGYVRNARLRTEKAFAVNGSGDPKWTFELVTSPSTTGHAAILANVLLRSGRAKIVSGPVPPTSTPIEEVVALGDGSGYILPIGTYVTEVSK